MVNTQTLLFLKAVEIGVLMGMLYDLLRILRKIIWHPNTLVQLEDFLYWISCACFSFLLLYKYNYSEIRPYVFLGMLSGAVFYFATFSVVFMKVATWAIDCVKRFLRYVIHILSIPVRWVIGVLIIPFRFLKKQYGHLKMFAKYQEHKVRRKFYQQQADFLTSRRLRMINKYLQEDKK
jgi:spore cortex biosynthesis protein YabQ